MSIDVCCALDVSFPFCWQNWQNVQLIHVFQELLISGCKTSGERRPDSSCPLPKLNDFEERFYLVVVEQMPEGNSALTMWLITIASQGQCYAIGGLVETYAAYSLVLSFAVDGLVLIYTNDGLVLIYTIDGLVLSYDGLYLIVWF